MFQDEQKRLKEAEKKVVESPWTKDAQYLISQHATERVKKEKLVVEKVRMGKESVNLELSVGNTVHD